ncbi:MAG: hypothetical protein LBR77_01220 [Lachnospiraceae bacterium]|nr:hypothetical protein [Lachnospiraceae bacterium]
MYDVMEAGGRVYAFLMIQELLIQYIWVVLKERLEYWESQKKGRPGFRRRQPFLA